MFQKLVLKLCILTLSFCIGCQGPSLVTNKDYNSCSWIVDEKVNQISTDQMLDQGRYKTIQKLWGLYFWQINRFTDGSGVLNVKWSDQENDKNYTLYLNDKDAYVVMEFKYYPPSIEQIIHCLGKPEYYSAYQMPSSHEIIYTVNLYYPIYGLMFNGEIVNPVINQYVDPKIKLNILIKSASVINIDKMIDKTSFRVSRSSIARELKNLKLFPADMHLLEFKPYNE